jgi:hypothetical protein
MSGVYAPSRLALALWTTRKVGVILSHAEAGATPVKAPNCVSRSPNGKAMVCKTIHRGFDSHSGFQG